MSPRKNSVSDKEAILLRAGHGLLVRHRSIKYYLIGPVIVQAAEAVKESRAKSRAGINTVFGNNL